MTIGRPRGSGAAWRHASHSWSRVTAVQPAAFSAPIWAANSLGRTYSAGNGAPGGAGRITWYIRIGTAAGARPRVGAAVGACRVRAFAGPWPPEGAPGRVLAVLGTGTMAASAQPSTSSATARRVRIRLRRRRARASRRAASSSKSITDARAYATTAPGRNATSNAKGPHPRAFRVFDRRRGSADEGAQVRARQRPLLATDLQHGLAFDDLGVSGQPGLPGDRRRGDGVADEALEDHVVARPA